MGPLPSKEPKPTRFQDIEVELTATLMSRPDQEGLRRFSGRVLLRLSEDDEIGEEDKAHVSVDPDGERRIEVGFLEADEFLDSDFYADDENERAYEILDPISSEHTFLYESIQENLNVLLNDDCDCVRGFVFLRQLYIEPKYRRRGIGVHALIHLVKFWRRRGRPTHLFLFAIPQDPGEDGGDPYDYRKKDPEAYLRQETRLMGFYRRLGFQSLGPSPVMVLGLDCV